MVKKISTGRSRGHIRQRGGSFQVLVYAELDPLTGKEIRLTGSTSTATEAKALLKRFRAQVDEQRAPKTKASFRAAMSEWLRVLDVEESTRESYEQYARVHLYPAFGDEPVSRVTAQLLEAFTAARAADHRAGRSQSDRGAGRSEQEQSLPASGAGDHRCADRGGQSQDGVVAAADELQGHGPEVVEVEVSGVDASADPQVPRESRRKRDVRRAPGEVVLVSVADGRTVRGDVDLR